MPKSKSKPPPKRQKSDLITAWMLGFDTAMISSAVICSRVDITPRITANDDSADSDVELAYFAGIAYGLKTRARALKAAQTYAAK